MNQVPDSESHSDEAHTENDPLLERAERQGEAALRDLVERALDLTREFVAPEDLEEQRALLFSLARTHPRFSTWLQDQEPRKVPESSGVVEKKDEAALQAAAARRAGGRAKRG